MSGRVISEWVEELHSQIPIGEEDRTFDLVAHCPYCDRRIEPNNIKLNDKDYILGQLKHVPLRFYWCWGTQVSVRVLLEYDEDFDVWVAKDFVKDVAPSNGRHSIHECD